MASMKLRKMKAWLITWEWIGDHARRDDKVAAIPNPRLGYERIRELVEFLYLTEYYTLSERMACALRKGRNPYPARLVPAKGNPWEIACGHNPFLRARLVDDLTVRTDPGGKEEVAWKERSKRAP